MSFKKIMLMMTILISTYFLAGCESTSGMRGMRYQTLNDVMEAWIGSNESALVSSWGAPNSSYQSNDGSKVLTWKSYRETADQYGYCTQTVAVDKNGIVTAWKYSFCDYPQGQLPQVPADRPVPQPKI